LKPRPSLEIAKRATSAALAAVVFAGTLASVTPAFGKYVGSPPTFDRRDVIHRAKTWTKRRIPYSQVGYRNGYRRDCSGFVSMAWGLPYNLVTWTIPLVAKRIPKADLAPGDVLLNPVGDRHVVIFEKWGDYKHRTYWVLEETGQNGVDAAIRRKVAYPYRIQGRLYHPYRYVGLSGYLRNTRWSDRQPVRNAATAKAAARKAAHRAAARKAAARRAAHRKSEAARKKQAAADERATKSRAAQAHERDARNAVPDSAVARQTQATPAPVNPVAMLFSTLARWVTGQPQN